MEMVNTHITMSDHINLKRDVPRRAYFKFPTIEEQKRVLDYQDICGIDAGVSKIYIPRIVEARCPSHGWQKCEGGDSHKGTTYASGKSEWSGYTTLACGCVILWNKYVDGTEVEWVEEKLV